MKTPLALLLAGSLALPAAAAWAQDRFAETDLVSDLAGRAALRDSNLVNPWGVEPGGSGVFWASNNATGTSTLYRPDGTRVPLVVTIPGGGNTGVAVTAGMEAPFNLPGGVRATFIFVSENGTIAGWNAGATAVQVASEAGAVFKGLALAYPNGTPRLYAADFGNRRVSTFDDNFQPLTLTGDFTDPHLPTDYAPFNIYNVGGRLIVAFAQHAAVGEDENAGPGLGLLDIFDTDGRFLRRLVSPGGALNAPWGMALAPPGFGRFGGELIVGNFGDGMLNAYSLTTGAFSGTLQDSTGAPLAISGLWGIHFGRIAAGPAIGERLYFAAGLDDETHGLFGYLAAVGVEQPCDDRSPLLAFWRNACVPTPHGIDDDDAHHHGRDGDHDGDDDGHHDGDHEHHKHERPAQLPADSLAALFDCVASFSHTFGAGGCFRANCDLLSGTGGGLANDAARGLLALMLDRCAGLVCDSTVVACPKKGHGGGDGDDDRAHPAHLPAETIGDLITALDTLLCKPNLGGLTASSLSKMLACAPHAEEHGDDQATPDGHDALSAAGSTAVALAVTPLGGNPARLSSGVRFLLRAPAGSDVRFAIYDAAGRLVAEPLRGAAPGGLMTVAWDGRDASGLRVAAGSYFYRVTAGDQLATGRFVALR